MKLVEKAKFIQAIITNENLQISASLARLEGESDGQETV